MGYTTGHKRGGTKPKNVKLRPAPAPAPPISNSTSASTLTSAVPTASSSKPSHRGKAKKPAVDEDGGGALDDSGYGDGGEQEVQEAEGEGDDDELAFREELRAEKKPLRQCIVCLSGLKDIEKVRRSLYALQGLADDAHLGRCGQTNQKNYAIALGAKVDSALTVDTTHLVCLKPEGAKYSVRPSSYSPASPTNLLTSWGRRRRFNMGSK